MNEHTPDCCFATDKNWFRYRTAALIVEEGEVSKGTAVGDGRFEGGKYKGFGGAQG